MRRGRTYNSAIAAVQKFAAKSHVALLRASKGRFGGRVLGGPVLVLITTGRRSGERRETPLLYVEDGNSFAVIASNGGTASHPAWFLNLASKPEAEVRIGDRTFPVRAEEASGEERRRIWDLAVEMYPTYEDYQGRTDREIPVVALRRI
ncbi:MAG: nitroreductase family deazaflavin-dependent oxidoreductase [Actinomycetota bacterium]|jgi:deazaflavin-dependent oxidoreductase (nitroreductase family)|nr:nitroreductase family deazaflavin-dependent oxidoreductase [Rubrobacter sp.]MDQ3506767.1 nitroreductase family deazaflavin-dependent oxidoreductase [Actinomycetota bacterium]